MKNFFSKLRYSLLFILQILDGYFTYCGIQKFGSIDVEGNPIVHYIMTQLGPLPGLVLIKSIVCIFIVLLFWETKHDRVHIKLFPRCLDFFILLYSVVVWIWFELLFMNTHIVGNFVWDVIQIFS